MDGLPENQPNPFEQKKNALLEGVEFGLGGILLGIGTFFLMLFVLNYFNIVSLSQVFPNQLSWLPHRGVPSGTPPTPIQSGPTPTPTKLSLSCPVQKEFCNTSKITKYKGDPALAYNIASGSSILNAAQIKNSDDFDIFENPVRNTKLLYASTQAGNTCYMISYIIPPDSTFNVGGSFPVSVGQDIGSVSASTLSTDEGTTANLILLVKRITDPQVQCTVRGNQKRELGTYERIETVEIL